MRNAASRQAARIAASAARASANARERRAAQQRDPEQDARDQQPAGARARDDHRRRARAWAWPRRRRRRGGRRRGGRGAAPVGRRPRAAARRRPAAACRRRAAGARRRRRSTCRRRARAGRRSPATPSRSSARRASRSRSRWPSRSASSSQRPSSWRWMPASSASRKSGKSRSNSGSIVSSVVLQVVARVVADVDLAVAAVVGVDRLDLLGRVVRRLGGDHRPATARGRGRRRADPARRRGGGAARSASAATRAVIGRLRIADPVYDRAPMDDPSAFASKDEFEAWMEEQPREQRRHLDQDRQEGHRRATVARAEALDVALCFGWIDGQRKALDETYFLQKYTPRRARSEVVEDQRRQGRGADRARARCARPGSPRSSARRPTGAGTRPTTRRATSQVPPDLQAELDARPRGGGGLRVARQPEPLLDPLSPARRQEARDARAPAASSTSAMLKRGETASLTTSKSLPVQPLRARAGRRCPSAGRARRR